MTRLNTFLLITAAGAAFGCLLGFLTGCGGDDACEAGLVPAAPGVCKVPGGDPGAAGEMTRVGGQTGQPGGILPPSTAAGSRAGSGGRSGMGGGGESGHAGAGGTGGQVAVATAAGMSGKPAVDGGTGGREVAGQGGFGGAGRGGSGGTGGAGSGGLGGEPEPMSTPTGGMSPPPVITPPKAGMTAPPPPPPPPPAHFCGDGTIDSGETCDGDCATTCEDGDSCTADSQIGSPNLCNVECKHAPITKAGARDGCCPSGANADNDDDCPDKCGDGVVTGDELCDGDCPTTCVGNPNPCTRETLTGTGCQRKCESAALPAGTTCGNGKCSAAGVCEFTAAGSGAWYGVCSVTADCPSGAACLGGICTTNCMGSTSTCHSVDAGFNQSCISSTCFQGGCSGTGYDDSNCPAGQWCTQSASGLKFCTPKPK
jgi:hypothetical protein